MECKKGEFGGIKDLGVSLKNRKLLFYGICIWVRLGLSFLAYKYTTKKWFPYLVAIICLLSIKFVHFEKDNCVWWSRKMHFIILILVLCTSIFQIITKNDKPIIAFLILIDLLLGLSSSFYLKWF